MFKKSYENLANAVVLQAVKDYRSAKRGHNCHKINELEEFFCSNWFTVLTDADGMVILERLQEE